MCDRRARTRTTPRTQTARSVILPIPPSWLPTNPSSAAAYEAAARTRRIEVKRDRRTRVHRRTCGLVAAQRNGSWLVVRIVRAWGRVGSRPPACMDGCVRSMCLASFALQRAQPPPASLWRFEASSAPGLCRWRIHTCDLSNLFTSFLINEPYLRGDRL